MEFKYYLGNFIAHGTDFKQYPISDIPIEGKIVGKKKEIYLGENLFALYCNVTKCWYISTAFEECETANYAEVCLIHLLATLKIPYKFA